MKMSKNNVVTEFNVRKSKTDDKLLNAAVYDAVHKNSLNKAEEKYLTDNMFCLYNADGWSVWTEFIPDKRGLIISLSIAIPTDLGIKFSTFAEFGITTDILDHVNTNDSVLKLAQRNWLKWNKQIYADTLFNSVAVNKIDFFKMCFVDYRDAETNNVELLDDNDYMLFNSSVLADLISEADKMEQLLSANPSNISDLNLVDLCRSEK